MIETGVKTYFGKDGNEYKLEYLEDDYGNSYVHVGLIRMIIKSIRKSFTDKDKAFDELDTVLYDVGNNIYNETD